MTGVRPDDLDASTGDFAELSRLIGVVEADRRGPTLLCLGGIHGNEPAGVRALQRVVAQLQEHEGLRRGRLVALAGNLAALRAGQRFRSRDLNRAWLPRDLDALVRRDPAEDRDEDREQRELLACFDRELARGRRVCFLDLHTSSAEGASFSCMSDTLANRRLALSLPVPMILGLEECIDGAVMEYFNQRSCVAVAVEGGQHSSPQSISNLEAACWLALERLGMLRPRIRDLDADRQCLLRTRVGLPAVLEIRHRQAILPGQSFAMEPGFRSFQAVRKGQVLATLDGEQLRAEEDCRVLLPLYQDKGDDGYFLVRGVGWIWLLVASFLRRMRLYRVLHLLPGVRRHPEDPDVLVTDPRLARWFRVQIFHLLGYRRRRQVDQGLSFSRRPDPELDGRP